MGRKQREGTAAFFAANNLQHFIAKYLLQHWINGIDPVAGGICKQRNINKCAAEKQLFGDND